MTEDSQVIPPAGQRSSVIERRTQPPGLSPVVCSVTSGTRGRPKAKSLGAPPCKKQRTQIGQRRLQDSVKKDLASVRPVDPVTVLEMKELTGVLDLKPVLSHSDPALRPQRPA